jgi:hypothetical protein
MLITFTCFKSEFDNAEEVTTQLHCIFVCQEEKARVIQTLLFVAGINTLLQTFFGTRLPVVMGGSYTFVAPTISIILAGRYNDVADPHEVLLPNRLVFLINL